MSLTSLLEQNENVRRVLKDISPTKKTFVWDGINPAFYKDAPVLAPYLLQNSSEAGLIGTAVDYMFRFVIARKIDHGKEEVLEHLWANTGMSALEGILDESIRMAINNKYNECVVNIRRFIYGENIQDDVMADIVLRLAYLEVFRRSGRLPDRHEDILDRKDKILIDDIKKLTDVFINSFIDSGIVRHDSEVVFNPDFGKWSSVCGGADADIYIDGTLYDFKTTKAIYRDWTEIGQLYGYYCLYRLCKRDNVKENVALFGKPLDAIAIYKSRHGMINKCTIQKSDADYSDLAIDRLGSVLTSNDEKMKEMQKPYFQEILDKMDRQFVQYPVYTYTKKQRNLSAVTIRHIHQKMFYNILFLGYITVTGFMKGEDGDWVVYYSEKKEKKFREEVFQFYKTYHDKMLVEDSIPEIGKRILVARLGYGTIIKQEQRNTFVETTLLLNNEKEETVNLDAEDWYAVGDFRPLIKEKTFPYQIGEKAFLKINSSERMVSVEGFSNEDEKCYVILNDGNNEFRLPAVEAIDRLYERKDRSDMRFILQSANSHIAVRDMKIGDKLKYITERARKQVQWEGVVTDIITEKPEKMEICAVIDFGVNGKRTFIGSLV